MDMVQHVLDNEVYNYPHITWLSKNQLLWGGNGHWKNCTDPQVSAGILRHAGIRKPSQQDLDYQQRRFGYCLEWPQPKVWDMVTSVVKTSFINKRATGEGFKSIDFLYGRGYIGADGKMDKDHTSGVVGWFIMANDPNVRRYQIDWVENQSIQIRGQWERCCFDFKSTVQQQIESGHKKAIINSYLLDQFAYKEIEQALNERRMITDAA